MDLSNLGFLSEAIEREVQARCQTALANPDGSVRPIRIWFPNGWASGTIHKVAVVDDVDVWATAFHVLGGDEMNVPEAMTLAGQLADYGKCYLLQRRGSPDRPDVHFFTENRRALDVFKASCPDPVAAARTFGLAQGSYFAEPTQAMVGSVSGYPHGVVTGEPQIRNITPFYVEKIDELLWFHTPEPVVGGMSGGGVFNRNTPDRSSGVLVAQAGRERKFYGLVQLFHNQMVVDNVA